MKRELIQLIGEELQLLRAEGVEKISVSDDVLAQLKASVPAAAAPPRKPEPKVSENTTPEIDLSKATSKGKKSGPADTASTSDPRLGEIPQFDIPDGSKKEQWETLRDRVLNCEVCRSNLNPGKKVVFGTGNLDAEIFFCGEAPGADEETEGAPFVGNAGQLLTAMIKAMGLSREEVYIANIMNWRPQTGNAYGNRPPTDEEMSFCLPYLKAQVQIIRPKVIVAMGGTAAKGLLNIETKGKMASLRGAWKEFEGTPLIITYHPSFLLHQNSVVSKRRVWEDLLAVMEKLRMAISDKQKNYFLDAIREGN